MVVCSEDVGATIAVRAAIAALFASYLVKRSQSTADRTSARLVNMPASTSWARHGRVMARRIAGRMLIGALGATCAGSVSGVILAANSVNVMILRG